MTKVKKTFGHPAPQVCKPVLAKLVKEWGGTTRLADALQISQSRISSLIYSDQKISDTIANKIVKLTEGKLKFAELTTMHIRVPGKIVAVTLSELLSMKLPPKAKKNVKKTDNPKV